MDDPKNRLNAPAAPTQFITLTADQFDAMLAKNGGSNVITDEQLAKQARAQAEAHRQLTHPENEHHPGKSVYSFPEGDVEKPRTPLKCQMFWVGYEETLDTLTPTEIDLLNQMVPGEYRFTRADGSPEQLTVVGETNTAGKLTKMNFLFKCRGEYRHNMPGKVQMLSEALGEQNELDKLRAENERLKSLAGVA